MDHRWLRQLIQWGLVASVLMVSILLILLQAPGIPGVVAPGVSPELVQDGFGFLEGPVGTAGGGLYFTDVFSSRFYNLDPSGQVSVLRDQSGTADGLAVNRDGERLAVDLRSPTSKAPEPAAD